MFGGFRKRFINLAAIAACGLLLCGGDASAQFGAKKPGGGGNNNNNKPGNKPGGNNNNNLIKPNKPNNNNNNGKIPTIPGGNSCIGRGCVPTNPGGGGCYGRGCEMPNKPPSPGGNCIGRGCTPNLNNIIPEIDLNKIIPNRPPLNNIIIPPQNNIVIPDYPRPPQNNIVIPNNIVPDRPPPQNTIPEPNNVPPPEVKPLGNLALIELRPASRNVAPGLLKLADEQAGQAAKDINDFVGPVTDPADMISSIQMDPNWNKLTPQEKKEVEEALKAQPPDPEAAKKALDGKGLDPATVDKLVSRVDIGKQNAELQDLVKSGGTEEQIKKKTEELQQSLDNAANLGAITYDPASRAGMRDLAEKLAKAAEIRDAVIDFVNGNTPLPGGNVPLPTGMITIIYDPLLPAGQVVALAANVLVVGTGPGGQLTIIDGTPEDAGLPIINGDPTNNATEDDAGMGGGRVLVINPEGSRGNVNYSVNGEAFTLEPNQHQELNNGDTIVFDRGRGNGRAEYKLEDGRYEFSIGDKGWDLHTLPALSITLDNKANPYDFNFVLDNQRRTIKARQTLTLDSKTLLVLSFDNGRGEVVKKVFDDSGTFKVGVNPETNGLDIFVPSEATATNEPPPAAENNKDRPGRKPPTIIED